MKDLNVRQPFGWASTSWFEDVCLSIDSVPGQTCPLFHAAISRWDELSALLMENGASPQSTCFFTRPRQKHRGPEGIPIAGTVLSRLIVSTQGAKDEVRDLLNTATHLNMDSIVTIQDINAILSLDAYRDSIYWDCGSLSWSPGANGHRDYDMQLWQAIAMADASQKQRVRDSQPKSTLIFEAARQRRFWAVKALLEMGLNPGAPTARWNVFQLNITALDLVSWTTSVNEDRCGETGFLLQERDAEIADLLLSHQATRGVEYRVEYQLLLGFYQIILAPVAITVALCFILYLDAPWLWSLKNRSEDLLDEITHKGKRSSLWITSIYMVDRIGTLVWSLFTTFVAIGCFLDKDMVPLLIFLGVIGAIPSIWKVYLVAAGEGDMRLFVSNNFFLDVADYLFSLPLVSYIFYIARMDDRRSTRLGYLADVVHGNSRYYVAWNALYSPFGVVIGRVKRSLWHILVFPAQLLIKANLCELSTGATHQNNITIEGELVSIDEGPGLQETDTGPQTWCVAELQVAASLKESSLWIIKVLGIISRWINRRWWKRIRSHTSLGDANSELGDGQEVGLLNDFED
jgi:hypothetical protein